MKTYIQCDVSKGMFDNECAVRLADYKGKENSAFVDKNIVKLGMLEISVLQTQGDLALIQLPCRLIESAGSGNYLTVKKEQIYSEN